MATNILSSFCLQFKLSVVFIFAAVQPLPGENRGTCDLLRAILQFNTKNTPMTQHWHWPGSPAGVRKTSILLNHKLNAEVAQANGHGHGVDSDSESEPESADSDSDSDSESP